MIHSKPSKLTQALIYATISCERFAWYLMLSGLVLALVERGLDKATASESYGLLLLAAYFTQLGTRRRSRPWVGIISQCN